MGEGLPFWPYRIDYMYKAYTHGHPNLKKTPSEYLKENFVITTSGMNDHKVLKYCVDALGADSVIFAIDYPYQDMVESANFMNTSPLPEADNEKIAHGTTERLFHIRPADVS
jgi:5-carboxyvanillate decarboxylase